MGIHISGGTVIASGHMLDRIEDNGQNYVVFNFAEKQRGNETINLKNSEGKTVLDACPENAYSILIFSSPDLTAGTYTLWCGNIQLAGNSGGMAGGHGMRPDDMTQPEMPEGGIPPESFELPKDFTHPNGEMPPEIPEGNRPEKPFGERPDMPNNNNTPQELSNDFIIKDGGNMFGNIMIKNA